MGKTRGVAFVDRLTRAQSNTNDKGCWIWDNCDKNGYGHSSLRHEGKFYTHAHAAVYVYSGGEIPQGMQCHHKCRNRSCVNPSHIEVVTRAKNLEYRSSEPSPHSRPRVPCPHGMANRSQCIQCYREYLAHYRDTHPDWREKRLVAQRKYDEKRRRS